MSASTTQRGITFFDPATAPTLDEAGIMSAAQYSDDVLGLGSQLAKLAAGSHVSVLHRDSGDTGFSLVHAWFGAGYRLPRHSHNADCLYYVLAGEAILGSRHVGAGCGFVVRADQPYAYEAGPDGVEVLEFRSATSFDMRVFDQTAERWAPIVAAAHANHDTWKTAPR